jgi:hypothetical protein
MKRAEKDAIACRFSSLNFHDDDLLSVRLLAPRRKNDSAKLDFEFLDYSTRAKKLLSICGCVNLRWSMDFDVLADNWYAQTEAVKAESDPQKMKKFVRTQMRHWRVKYMPPLPMDKPIRKQLSSILRYRLFRITFFGGTVEVLARNFILEATGGARRKSRSGERGVRGRK